MLEEIHANQREQEVVDARMRNFRKQNFAIQNGQLVFESPTMSGRAALEIEWRSLLSELGRLDQVRNVLLKEYAELKTRG